MDFSTRVENEMEMEDEEERADVKTDLQGETEPAWPQDPANPQNWSFGKKIYHTLIACSFAFTVTFASSVYTPAVPEVMEQFNCTSTIALLGLSLYVLGLAFGPIMAAPLSETFGRSVVYITSLPVFAVFILGSGFAKNVETMIICRFFAGLFGAPALSVGGGTLADIWSPRARGMMVPLFLLAPFFGPSVGPLIGGFATARFSWRWTSWVTLFVVIPTYAITLGMKESYKITILRKRNPVLHPPHKISAAFFKTLLTATLIRPLNMLITEPIVLSFSLYVGFNFAVLYTFFACFPFVFRQAYGFDGSQTGMVFLANSVGCLCGVLTHIYIELRVYRKVKDVKPEHRLYQAMVGSMLLPIALFWFAWTARKEVHWISPVLATVPFAWGNLLVFISSCLYLIDTYGAQYGASALAANAFMRYIFGTAFPLFTLQMYQKLGTDWATSLLAFVTIAMLPIPWLLFRYGGWIRSYSIYK